MRTKETQLQSAFRRGVLTASIGAGIGHWILVQTFVANGFILPSHAEAIAIALITCCAGLLAKSLIVARKAPRPKIEKSIEQLFDPAKGRFAQSRKARGESAMPIIY